MPKIETMLASVIKIENEEEQRVLDEFKEKVQDLRKDEVTLLRFMRARDYNLDKAEEMLRKSMEWRKENEINSILEWTVPKHLCEALPFKLLGVDNEGAAVLYIPLGKWQGRQLVEKGLKHECLKLAHYVLETGYKEVLKDNKPIQAIIALEHLSLYQVSHIETMQTLFAGCQHFESNYPEVLKKVYVVNAPWIFTMAYNFVKPILSAHTIAKIQVFGSNKKQWLPVLLQNMPTETIPQEYLQE